LQAIRNDSMSLRRSREWQSEGVYSQGLSANAEVRRIDISIAEQGSSGANLNRKGL
jgi:hypothetical protein